MKGNKFWIKCGLAGLAVLAMASIGSSAQRQGQDKHATDARSTIGMTGYLFCSGDGSSGKCADPEPTKWGHGCRNSTGAGGLLMGRGSARLSQDNLELEASYLPVPTTVVFMESTDAVVKGMGYPFGDGVLCLTRNVHRFAVKQPRKAGIATYPNFGDSPLGIAGKVDLLQPTRYYQVMYRDNGGAAGRTKHFNLTNGLMVVWGP